MNTVRLGWFKDIIGWPDDKKPQRPKYPAMPVDEGAEIPSRSDGTPAKPPVTQSKANPLGLSGPSSTPATDKKTTVASTEKPATTATSTAPTYTYTPPPKPDKKGPRIGILVEYKPSEGSSDSFFFKATGGVIGNYADAVREAGGVVQWVHMDANLQAQMRGLHGLVIPGGGDLNPEMYDPKARSGMGMACTSKRFDNFEKDAYLEAKRMGLPIAGICRGMQLINVVEGGTLLDDINDYLRRPYNYKQAHRGTDHVVVVVPNSRFGQIMGGEEVIQPVSNHHQAIGVLAAGWIPVAVASDQIIEAIENPELPNVTAVQFHPERSNPAIKKKFFDDIIGKANTYWKEHPNVAAYVEQPVVRPVDPPPVSAPASATVDAAAPKERVNHYHAGLKALRGFNIEVHDDWNKRVDEETFDKINGASGQYGTTYGAYRVHHIGKGDTLAEVHSGQLRELLLSMTHGGIAQLPDDTRKGVTLAGFAREAGVSFYRKKMFGKEHLTFDIQAVWQMRDEKLVAAYKSPVSGEVIEDRINDQGHLSALIDQLRRDRAAVNPPPAAPPPKGAPVVQERTVAPPPPPKVEEPVKEAVVEQAPPPQPPANAPVVVELEPAESGGDHPEANAYKDFYKRFQK